LLNKFLLQTLEFLINILDPQIGYEEKFSGAFFKCSSIRGFIESRQSRQKGFGNFLAMLLYSSVPIEVKNVGISILNMFDRFRVKIYFQAEWLFTSRLNHENLKAVKLAYISGKPNPPLS